MLERSGPHHIAHALHDEKTRRCAAPGLLGRRQEEETHVVALVGGGLKSDPAGRVVPVVLVDGFYEYFLGAARVRGARGVVLEPRELVEPIRASLLRQQRRQQHDSKRESRSNETQGTRTTARVCTGPGGGTGRGAHGRENPYDTLGYCRLGCRLQWFILRGGGVGQHSS